MPHEPAIIPAVVAADFADERGLCYLVSGMRIAGTSIVPCQSPTSMPRLGGVGERGASTLRSRGRISALGIVNFAWSVYSPVSPRGKTQPRSSARLRKVDGSL